MSGEIDRSRPATVPEQQVMTTRQGYFAAKVEAERKGQDRKWGRNVVDVDRMIVVFGEEFGEVCRAVLEGDLAGAEKELVQCAAVCSKLFELLGLEVVARQVLR